MLLHFVMLHKNVMLLHIDATNNIAFRCKENFYCVCRCKKMLLRLDAKNFIAFICAKVTFYCIESNELCSVS